MSINGETIECPGKHVPPTTGLVRKLAWRYFLVLATVAVLIVVDQVAIQPQLSRLSYYAPVINVAGRQRMLSQKLTKAALALRTADNAAHRRDELRETIAQWTAANGALREGSPELGILRIHTPEIAREWDTLDPHFQAMRAAAFTIAHASTRTGDTRFEAATITILEHEAAFLESMDRIVTLLENEAAAAVIQLRVCAGTIAAGVVGLVLALGWLVICPATRTIRRQIDELETQVAARTGELTFALDNLKHETSERKVAEDKTRRLAAQLAHAARVSTMGHLTAGLAHELNQPLATIANYAEACDVELEQFRNGARPERLRQNLEQAKRAALRAGQIVRRMRNFIRPQMPATAHAEINSLICDVVELCRVEAEHAGATIVLELEDENATVCVDSIQIQQVLVNLVQNALHAVRECPIDERHVCIRTSVMTDFVYVDVIDFGAGFASPDSEAAFTPFYTTKRDGLGIGLSICRAIVEEHGGEIWADAKSCRGAKVSFTLPLTLNAENDVGIRRALPERVCH